jgi:acid stress-induced BolA-like protein IbaG/YrbA
MSAHLPKELDSHHSFQVEAYPGGYRDYVQLWVISDYFEPLDLIRRGELVWDVLKKHLPQEKWLKVSMLLALTPDEFERYQMREAMLDALET